MAEERRVGPRGALDDAAVASFHPDGYVLVPGLLDEEEAGLLLATALADRRLAAHATGWPDDEGGVSRITVWNEPGDDIYGMVARSERIVGSMSRLLDDEVYHYHSKLKRRRIGSAEAVADAFAGKPYLANHELDTVLANDLGIGPTRDRTSDPDVLECRRQLALVGYVWNPPEEDDRWEPGIPSLMDYVASKRIRDTGHEEAARSAQDPRATASLIR